MAELASAVVIAAAMSLPTAIYLWLRRKRPGGRRAMGLTWGAPSDYVVAVALAAALVGLVWLALRAVPADVLATAGATNRITGPLVGLAVAIRASGEEMLFRGFLQGILAGRFGRVAGTVGQGVLFGLVHLPLLGISPTLWPLITAQFVTGLALGWLRSRHDSIAAPVVLHVASNVVAGLLF